MPVEPDEHLAAGDPAFDDWLVTQERGIALREAFAGLPERCRRLLAMLFADPPTPYLEISAEVGMAVGAIGPSRQRCLDRLRRSPSLAALYDTTGTEGR